MKREQITRDDFPAAGDGYDRLSVDAHLAAVAAWTAALEAQINSLEVERDALRRQSAEVRQTQSEPNAGRAASALDADQRPAPPEPAPPVAVASEAALAEPEETPSVVAEPTGPKPVPTGPDDDASPNDQTDDEVSARLVATRLALEGAEPEQIRDQLVAAYELEDPDALIEDVLARLA